MKPSVGACFFGCVTHPLLFTGPVFASIYRPVTEPVTHLSFTGRRTQSAFPAHKWPAQASLDADPVPALDYRFNELSVRQ